MSNKKNDIFLTIHGHFYQPPRENPWLEAIELQDSALPFHDWNERINKECYNPNSVSKIVDSRNRILDVVNNYEYMSYNFGPTLLSWMEQFAPLTYERIIKADIESIPEHNGHGNALAQVYNHIIMPLANEEDKQTQVKWGIRDFEYRFGRKPEGMWLAETAVDDDTLRVLEENGIKFTILSPYQAAKFRKKGEKEWTDVSWGNIDPARSYRYYIKSAPGKYIDLFFYDGAISRSVAFDELLKDGNKFSKRLKEGVSECRDYPQLINIATDGESYGHHTKFGDMALAYVLKIKAKDEGFTITNYGEYLEKYRSDCEVDIKQASSWSCFHGVGRWKEDCGCSTGGHPGWNQKWRKPLRDALDYLRDELVNIYEDHGKKYFNNDVWEVRNKYVDVILDRGDMNVRKFQQENFLPNLSDEDKVRAMELLEIQRQSMLMYTSCGWFFSEISGIETVQIMKYAARAMQLAAKFTDKNIEEHFLNILAEAKSNIPEHGTGKDIFERFVKPSIVTAKQIASLWALSSLYQDFEDEEDVYCYTITKKAYKKVHKGTSTFIIGHIEVQSKITLQKSNLIFALMQYSGGDFHCAIKEYSDEAEFNKIKTELIKTYLMNTLTEIIRALDEYFGKEYFTLKDIFIEERRKILQILLKGKLEKFAQTYQEMYDDGKGAIYNLQGLGLKIPDEFKISAGYALSHKFNDIVAHSGGFLESDLIQQAMDINFEAKKMDVTLDKKPSNAIFSKKILQNMNRLVHSFEIQQADVLLEIFDTIEKLELQVDISEAQNIYFAKIYHRIGDIIENGLSNKRSNNKKFIEMLLDIGSKLNINTEFYQKKLDKLLLL
ncbi:TPA: glycoside hydrolase [Candidatus Gastranaerophilales bacterium HUM_20]|nr:glycoside hydrolase [Clostridium sp. CAG:729]DAB20228.1 MAG TPA: glycoside hydrolase [Candidatus Gastranaerophilales bacterium HUM_20]